MELYGLFPTAFIFLLATYIFLKISKRLFINKKKKLPPGPNGLPLIGSLITIGDRAHEALANLAKTYGPLMTVKLGFINVIVVSSPEMAREIYQKHDVECIGRPIADALTAEEGYDLSLPWLPANALWKKLRKICNSHILSPQKLDSLQDLRHQVMKNLIQRVVQAREAGEAIQIGNMVFGTAVQLLSNSIFSDDVIDPSSNAMKEQQELNANIMFYAGQPNLADYFPFLRPFDLQGIRRNIKPSYIRLHQLIDDMIDRRMKRRTSSGSDRCGDILDVLLDYTEHEGPESLTRQDVKLLIIEIFIGGTDTTTVTVEWAMTELLHYPTILSKVKKELSEKIVPGKAVQEQDLPRLPYLNAVIKETMRFHPTAPFLLPRRAEQDVEIQGYTIPKHTRIWINFWSIARDAASWNEPTSFIPERFLNSDIDFRGRDFSFTPFGGGRRICPGVNLAVRMVSLILATLVQNFDWKLPGGMAPEDIDITDIFGITLRKAQPLSAIPLRTTTT